MELLINTTHGEVIFSNTKLSLFSQTVSVLLNELIIKLLQIAKYQGTMKVCTECTPSLYLESVLFWPDDGFLQTKHVAKILKYRQFADIYIYCVFRQY